jgi:copper(I)-binding protein
MTAISRLIGITLLFTVATTANAEDIVAGDLVITQAWSRATPGGSQVAGGYLTIENRGTVADRLVSAGTTAASKVEIHEMAVTHGIMAMRAMDRGLIIEPGKTVKLAPGARHLMLVGLVAPLQEGDQISVSLDFDLAGRVNVPFAVQGIGAQAPLPMTDVRLHDPLAAAASAPVEDRDEPFFTHFCDPKAMANITVSPGRVGPVEIAIQLEDGDERPLTTARGVSVTLANPDKGIAPAKAVAVHVGDDKWLVKMNAPESGRWNLALGIELSASDRVDIEAPIVIR